MSTYQDRAAAEERFARGETPEYEPSKHADQPQPEPLELIDASTLDGVEPPRREFVVEGLLPRRAAVLLAGDGGVGKSFLALQLAECLRHGEPFLGRGTTAGTTLVYSCEDEAEELHRRLHRLQRSLGLPSTLAKRILLAPRVGTLNALVEFDNRTGVAKPTAAFDALKTAAIENKVDLIVVDTVAQTFPGNENERAAVTVFLNLMAGLALGTNSCVLLLAHPPKNGAEFSGSTSWNGTVRARVFLQTKDEDGARRFFLRLSKANYAPEFEEELIRDDNGVMWLADKAPASMADKISAYQELAQYKTIFLSALDILTRQGRAISHSNRAPNFAPKAIIAAELGLGCSVRQLTTAMEALFKDGVITANAVVGKKPNRVPITGIARTIPLADQPNTDRRDDDEPAEEGGSAEGSVIDLNRYPEAAE
ncbi:AAA family ATPase [Geminicoccus flavidas]|uniref:AAA family ATPase n=1 Tax=Geminicoccus flavidas TaxID=2506407 RepID=UPI00135A46E0|nr:AAA family ATPase [Geminicoccus flavidas]